MSLDNHQAAAQALRQARETRQPIRQVSESHGIRGLDSAYRVAEINTRVRIEHGHRIIGMKVGLTSGAVQKQLGVDQPDFGVLFDDMEYLNGDEVPVSKLLQPKIEAEVALILGRDIQGSAPSYGEFLASLAYAVPAIEIVDSAIEDWKITLEDTVADNASCGLFVLGNQPVEVGRLFLDETGMSLSINGAIVSVGAGAACLGHPLRAAYWLACTMADRKQGLKAGQVILTGALGQMVTVNPGDEVAARIGGLGMVGCSMV